MGTAITDILDSKEIILSDLKGKTLAVDSFNMLYQFLSSIRQPDGTPLKDSKGNVTSHLVGLFSRITKLLLEDIKLVFVFDGETPDLKKAEQQRRKEIKLDASSKYEEAKENENIEDMKKYASRTSKLTKDMIEESKEFLKSLGCCVVQAPSEGEAQASYMVAKGDCYAIISQDADTLLFGANKVIKNLIISGKRKQNSKLAYKTINPEIISLSDNLNKLKINQDQLIVLAILTGTDFNIGGVKGIGPKKALQLVQLHGDNFDKIFEEVEWNFDYSWNTVFDLIKNMPTTDDYKIQFPDIDVEKINELLVKKHDFSQERVDRTVNKLLQGKKEKAQKGLGDFF